MFTDLDKDDGDDTTSNSDSSNSSNSDSESKNTDISDTDTDATDSEFDDDNDDIFSDDSDDKKKKKKKKKKQLELEAAQKAKENQSAGQRLHEMIYGPEEIIDWDAKLNPETCGKRIRSIYTPGEIRKPVIYVKIDKSISPGTQTIFVCQHGQGKNSMRVWPIGETCPDCIDDAERRLMSLASSRFNIAKDESTVELLEFNTAMYWNHVGVKWEDTFRVEPWEFVEHRLTEKYLFGEHSLICLAFEVQLFWNVVRYYKIFKNPDQRISKASDWYKARKYSGKNHRKIRHFEGELQDLFNQYDIQLKGETMPPVVVMLMQRVFLDKCEHEPFNKLVLKEKEMNRLDHIAMSGWHPLHIAAIKNEVEMADMLLKNGAYMYPFDGAGYSPLHYACLYNNHEVAMMLIKHGTDIYMKNREGNNSLEICLNLKHLKLAKKIADTKKLKTEFLNRAKGFYEGLMSGDAEYYDARYGGGEHIYQGWKEGCRFLGQKVFLYKMCAMALIKRPSFFRSKVAKEFNIIAFYDDKKLGELGKKIFRQKTVDAWKSLVQRWDPVGTKKNWSRTLRPVAKKFFKKSIVHPTKRIKVKEVYERLLAGANAYNIWYEKNNPQVNVEYEDKLHKKRQIEFKRMEAGKSGKKKKKDKKKDKKKKDNEGDGGEEKKEVSEAEKILAAKKKAKPKYL